MSKRSLLRLKLGMALLLPSLVLALGCTGGGKGKISGKVTFKGAPMPGGSINFRADDGKEYGSSIGPDGAYYVENVPSGNMKVYISIPVDKGSGAVGVPKGREKEMEGKMKPPPGAPPEAMKAYEGSKEKHDKIPNIPDKYKSPDSSGLTFTVKSGSNTYDVPLSE